MRTRFAAALMALGPLALAPAMAQTAGGSPPAVTHVQTAADLAAVCDPAVSGVPRLESIAYCQGFLTSAGQYHTLLYPAGGGRKPLYCAPNPPPTIAQAGLAFAAWTRANPAHATEPALDGLLRWAQSAYPCPQPAAPAARTTRPAR
jgi:hypothetical protein